MLEELRAFWKDNGISAVSFACPWFRACSEGCTDFTTAKEAYVGSGYERGGRLPRVLFISADSGSAWPQPEQRTAEEVRKRHDHGPTERLKTHWRETHDLALCLLKEVDPGLTNESVATYFAHLNSAKCCQNRARHGQASAKIFRNCRDFVRGEIPLLKPDVIVTQGVMARKVLEGDEFRSSPVEGMPSGKDSPRQVTLADGRICLWFPLPHPAARGGAYKKSLEDWQNHYRACVRNRWAVPS